MLLKTSLSNNIRKLIKNKLYFYSVIIITIASYGFAITHFSMGIDDFGVYHYMNLSPNSVGNMLQQGRLIHIVFYYLFGLSDILPFLNNFIGALLLAGSCIIIIALIKSVINERLTISIASVFSGIYISCSIISFKFIYDIDVVVTMLSYLCAPLSIYYGLKYIDDKKKQNFIYAVGLCVLTISSYESFCCVYICEVLFILSLLYLYEELSSKKVIVNGLIQALVLLCSVILYYGVVKTIQMITENSPYTRTNIFNAGATITRILKVVIERYFYNDLFFVKEFGLFVILLIIVMLYYTFIKRKYLCLLLFPMIGFFTIGISIIQTCVYYRTGQTVNVFFSITTMFLLLILNNKNLLMKLSVGIFSILILWQVEDINRWFYQDWISYQKNVNAIHIIATDLMRDYNVQSKPVCFVNRDYTNPLLMTWDEGIQYEIGESALISAVSFLGDVTSPAVIELFKYQGYEFIIEPTVNQVKQAQELSKEMTAYPKQGYIEEHDEFIIVNFGLH